jgi:amino acid efflux transporter
MSSSQERRKEMKAKKLGPLLLSGLMVGPILGSGIILLPPLIYHQTGAYAIIAWMVILGIGYLFANLFGKLSIHYPHASGIAYAAERAFSYPIRQLASLFLVIAGSIAPVAILMTAGHYLSLQYSLFKTSESYGLLLLCGCLVILLLGITSLSIASLAFSTIAAGILFLGGITTLPLLKISPLWLTPFSLQPFGYSILLLFWSLVGWEIIGNYSAEIAQPQRTIPKAILLSSVIITLVSLIVAISVQWIDPHFLQPGGALPSILFPLFGEKALVMLTWITTLLCMSTYLLVTGGAARLLATQYKTHASMGALLTLGAIHTLIFLCLSYRVVSIEQIVATANAFFIAYSLCGAAAAHRLLPKKGTKINAILLGSSLLLLLSFSHPSLLVLLLSLTVFFLVRHLRLQKKRKQNILPFHPSKKRKT